MCRQGGHVGWRIVTRHHKSCRTPAAATVWLMLRASECKPVRARAHSHSTHARDFLFILTSYSSAVCIQQQQSRTTANGMHAHSNRNSQTAAASRQTQNKNKTKIKTKKAHSATAHQILSSRVIARVQCMCTCLANTTRNLAGNSITQSGRAE